MDSPFGLRNARRVMTVLAGLACAVPMFGAIAVGCGSSNGAGLFKSGEGGAGVDGSLGTFGEGGVVLASDGGSGITPVAFDAAGCATDHAGAALGIGYLVFVMDRSDSMQQDSKWPSCSTALDTFFSNSKAAGIQAQLTWLPEVTAGTHSTSGTPTFLCTESSYTTPDVPLSALPSPAFSAAIADASLEYGTPTLPAIQGAGAQAQALLASNPGSKVVIVLATDGLPAGCTGDTIDNVADAAAGLSEAGVLTYVIGVGTATTNLDEIASAGGTTKAFIVPTGDAGATAGAFLSAIQTVAGSLIPCDFLIPTPPNGETLDPSEVNVIYTASGGGGSGSALPYSAGCTNPSGWEYDNPSAPTKIELCSQSCTTVQGDPKGTIDVVFGCQTVSGPQ